MAKLVGRSLTGLAVLALLFAGFFKAYPIELFFGKERTVVLDATSPITPRAGLSYWAYLGKLKLHTRAYNAYGPPELHVQFFENDVPLVNEPVHSQIEVRPGLYSHWGKHIIFSPRAGGLPAGVYSIRYLELKNSLRWLGKITAPTLWCWTATVCLLCLALGRALVPRQVSAPASAFLLLGLAGAIAPYVVKSWDVAITQPDSSGYVRNVSRPPFYPWFLCACTAGAEWSETDFLIHHQPLAEPSAALLRTVRAQRVLFWTGFVLAAWGASLLVPCPLAVLFFFGLHLYGLFQPDLENCLMSETVAGAFLFLVTAAFCAVTARRWLWPLPVLAAAYGCLVLTRSAGFFAVVFLAVAVLLVVVANWQRKAALAGWLGLSALIGAACLSWLLWNSHAHNGVWAISPLKNFERVAFALQCADADDLQAMPDAEAYQFLRESLSRQQEEFARRGKVHPALEDFDLNLNCWLVAFPVARDLFEERFGPESLPCDDKYNPQLFAYVDGLIGRVADVVLARHRDRYLGIIKHSFFTLAAGDCTRLKLAQVPFLGLVALAVGACLFGRNRCALAGLICLLTHLAALVVISCFEQPLTRYVQFSEWVCLLGFLFAAWGCARRIADILHSRMLVFAPLSPERERRIEDDPPLAPGVDPSKKAA
jgi:hypothetical protein